MPPDQYHRCGREDVENGLFGSQVKLVVGSEDQCVTIYSQQGAKKR